MYDSWRGPFYPDSLPRRRWLEHASRCFDSLELNGSFYSLQRPESYLRWRAETPRGFVMAVKGSRFITHNKKLGDADTPLANFFASGVLALEEKLGPIVWQLAESLQFSAARMDGFFRLLPRDTESALRLARRRDRRLYGRSWLRIERSRRIRYAIEIRHPSFHVPEMARIARRHNVAIVVSDAGGWELAEEQTAGHVYVRLHGSPHTYATLYGAERLRWWANRIEVWRRGGEPPDAHRISELSPPSRKTRDVYVYFDNDQQAHAPRDALVLREILRGGLR
jgi:uncharacterized protein YecE (DUF72 family)